jgi:elongation factor G
VAAINDIRNVVLLGHSGCGKTILVEAILHKTGVINRLGTIEDGTTVTDFDEEEKQRQHSVHCALAHTTYEGKLINLIDTPGSSDFIGPSLPAMAAAETAMIVVSAPAGIEVNTRKLFEAATKAGLARIIVVNRIDAENLDLPALVKSIQQNFGNRCRCANLPTPDRQHIIDCLTTSSGDSAVMNVAEAHIELIESIVEADDDMMEAYLAGEQISQEKIAPVFIRAAQTGTVIPVIFTNARQEIGITELLGLLVRHTPSAAQPVAKLVDGQAPAQISADPAGPLAGLVFRIGFDPRSNMKYSSIRLFSGTLKSDSSIFRNDEKRGIRAGHILKSQGVETNAIEAGLAGDIITLAKIEELKLGDLVHDGSLTGKFVMPALPEPMYSLALEPAARGDEQKIGAVLERLSEEDPCFRVTRDMQTKELVVSGLGDLHLRVMLSKMQKRFKLSVNTRQPKIPYRGTITTKADGHYRHKKQTGGAGQFGEVYLRVEPAPRGSDPTLQASWDIFGGSIPSQYEPAVIKGIQDVMQSGVVAGFPLQDIKVSVYDGKHHPVDSKEVAFRAAGKGAFLDAVQKAKPVLLEPIINVEITVPAENMGDIAGDLAARRGRIIGQEMLGPNMVVIKAQAPLAELLQYNTQLKSATAGQGSYSMSLSHYEVVPPNIQQQIVAGSDKQPQS